MKQQTAQSLNSILYADLPTKIKVNNKVYDINYDYRTVIRIILALEDNSLYNNEKAYIMVKLLYKEDVPMEDFEEACEKASRFIDMNQKFDENNKAPKRIYSFTKDASYIFTGINSTHHIDLLETPNLHWWKFMALFMDMGTENTFSELVYYRKRKNEGKLTKEEKAKYKEIKDLLELEPEETEETIKLQEMKNQFLKEFNKQ